MIDGHVVPEAAVAREAQGRRMASAVPDHRHHRVPAGLLGLSRRRRERARHRASASRRRSRPDQHTIELAGRMETELRGARLAHESMLAAVRLNAPSADDDQPGDDRAAARRAPRHRRGRARDGARRRRRLLPRARVWSAASATSRPPAITRCRPARRRNMPARWRSACRSTRCSRIRTTLLPLSFREKRLRGLSPSEAGPSLVRDSSLPRAERGIGAARVLIWVHGLDAPPFPQPLRIDVDHQRREQNWRVRASGCAKPDPLPLSGGLRTWPDLRSQRAVWTSDVRFA